VRSALYLLIIKRRSFIARLQRVFSRNSLGPKHGRNPITVWAATLPTPRARIKRARITSIVKILNAADMRPVRSDKLVALGIVRIGLPSRRHRTLPSAAAVIACMSMPRQLLTLFRVICSSANFGAQLTGAGAIGAAG
jgi:hypothetical protein